MIPKMLTFEEYHDLDTWTDIEAYHGVPKDSLWQWIWCQPGYPESNDEGEYRLYVNWYELEFSPLGKALK